MFMLIQTMMEDCSEIFGKLFFFRVADMVAFPTKTSSMVKTLQTMFMLFIVLKMVETTFSNFQEGFLLISPKLHRLCT